MPSKGRFRVLDFVQGFGLTEFYTDTASAAGLVKGRNLPMPDDIGFHETKAMDQKLAPNGSVGNQIIAGRQKTSGCTFCFGEQHRKCIPTGILTSRFRGGLRRGPDSFLEEGVSQKCPDAGKRVFPLGQQLFFFTGFTVAAQELDLSLEGEKGEKFPGEGCQAGENRV